jgi:serine O-acetyltransferase
MSAYEPIHPTLPDGSPDTRTVDEMPLREVMREDSLAALARDPAAHSLRDIHLYSVGTRIVHAYRRHHWLYMHGLKGLALFLAKRTRKVYGADIFPSAQIGRRFTIDHGSGIVIGSTSIIGDDCLIYQNVTLGMTGHHGGKRHPTLGDNVLVGAGAIILGNITVGSNARIGAGSVVVHDVPRDTTVVGVPAKVVRDRRFSGPHLVDDQGDALDLDDENIRWSCAL